VPHLVKSLNVPGVPVTTAPGTAFALDRSGLAPIPVGWRPQRPGGRGGRGLTAPGEDQAGGPRPPELSKGPTGKILKREIVIPVDLVVR